VSSDGSLSICKNYHEGNPEYVLKLPNINLKIQDIFLQIVREKLTRESPAAQSQVSQKETVEMNETPSSPIAPKSIETPVYTPSQTQQVHGQKKILDF